MRNLENINVSFCSYVLKKYILLLGAVAAAAALISGISIYKKRSQFFKSQAKSFYTIFAVKAPLTLSKSDGLALNYSHMLETFLLDRCGVIAIGYLDKPEFTALCNKKFKEKTGREIPREIVLEFSYCNSVVVVKINACNEMHYKDAVVFANIVADEGVGYLKKLDCVSSVQVLDRGNAVNHFDIPMPDKRVVKITRNNKTSGMRNNMVVLLSLFAVLGVVAVCFGIELLRNAVISEEDLHNITGTEVFSGLDKPLAVAAGRNIRNNMGSSKILTLIGDCSADKAKQLARTLEIDNIRVSSVYLSAAVIVDENSDNLIKSGGDIPESTDVENGIALNLNFAADNIDGFHKLLDKLSQNSEIVIAGIDSICNAPQLIPPAGSNVVICAVKGKTGNRELAELTTALKLCGIKLIGAII